MSTVGSELVQGEVSNRFSSSIGSSIDITSEARDLSQLHIISTVDEDDEDLYNDSTEGSSSVLLSLKESLTTSLETCEGNISLLQVLIGELAHFDENLHAKCTSRAVLDILPKNSNLGSEGDFSVIATGVDILVKYGVNLLKSKRNPNWRSIKMSNSVFMKKVKPLQGHGEVLTALGYTERNATSYDFPQSSESPDLKKVAEVTADLLILQKEFSEFCAQTHQNRDCFLTNFSNLKVGEPRPEVMPPTDLNSTALPKLQDVTESPQIFLPPGEAKVSSPSTKTPVPAPRRNLPQSSTPDREKVAEFPQRTQSEVKTSQTDTSQKIPVSSAGNEVLQSVDGTLVKYPQVRSPGHVLSEDASDIVPSVGVIKFPPKTAYGHEKGDVVFPATQTETPRWPPTLTQTSKSDTIVPVRRAPPPPKTNQTSKSDQLMKPDDFLGTPVYPRVPNVSQGGTEQLSTEGNSHQSTASHPPRDIEVSHQRWDLHGKNEAGDFVNRPSEPNQAHGDNQRIPLENNPYYMNFSGPPPIPSKQRQEFSDTTNHPVGPPEPHYQHVPQISRPPQQEIEWNSSQGGQHMGNPPRFPQTIQSHGHNHGNHGKRPGTQPTPLAPRFPDQMKSPETDKLQMIAPGSQHQQARGGPRVPFQEHFYNSGPKGGSTFTGGAPRFSPQHGTGKDVPNFHPNLPQQDTLRNLPSGFHGSQSAQRMTGFPQQQNFENNRQKPNMPPGAQPTPFVNAANFPAQYNIGKHDQPHQVISAGQGSNAPLASDHNRNINLSNSAGPPRLEEVHLEKCAMCEGKPGIIHCDKCQSARCESCDKRWHSHPKRKTHQTTRLISHKEVPAETTAKEQVPKERPCYICGEENIIETHCRTCSEFFCRECDLRYHRKADRSMHERETVAQAIRPPVFDPANVGEKRTPSPQAGARPKVASGEIFNHKKSPKEEDVRRTPTPVLSEKQVLESQLDNLLQRDVDILEKIDDLKRKTQVNTSSDIEAQLIKEDKILQHRHQELTDQINDVETKLLDLDRGFRRAVHQEQNPVGRDHRAPPRQIPVVKPRPAEQNAPQVQHGPPILVKRWSCEHCTSLNEASNGNICTICSKTTTNPQIEEHVIDSPVTIMRAEEVMTQCGPPQSLERPLPRTMKAPEKRPEHEQPRYETKEEESARRTREEERRTRDIEEVKSQQEQENLTLRLLIMYRNQGNFNANKEERYSLEEVATAWAVLERDGTMTMQPVEWLDKHLKKQLELFGGDVLREFCRRYNLNPKDYHQWLPNEYVHPAWLKNDGLREKTAAECLALLQEKVKDFCAVNPDVDEKHAAKLLLEGGFDPDRLSWGLQLSAAEEKRDEIEGWLWKMWDESYNVEGAIEQIEKTMLNETDKKEKIRMILMAEKHVVWAAVDTFFHLRYNEDRELADCLAAVESSKGDLARARDFFKDCSICFTEFGRTQLIGTPFCQCHICTECFIENFTILAQNTPCMYKFACPSCNEPKLEEISDEEFHDYFALLEMVLQQHLNPADFELFQQKLVIWGLIKDKNFRWCANGCSSGFINERRDDKIQCTNCQKFQCFACKKPWQEQHEGISCEEFEQWKKDNDPEFQAQGLAAHLKENGINCPNCKMRYELAKGGCMHFKCAQCMHEFCCGCNLPFLKYPTCRKFQSCQGKGLHAHHPRDCLYHLRDQECETLQKLLQDNGVEYNRANAAANLPEEDGCPVKEQREDPDGLVDVNCGKELIAAAGLCLTHYKEYLVSLINQSKIDPADILTAGELGAALKRDGQNIPGIQAGEADEAYKERLRQLLKAQIPLHEGGEAVAANRL